MFPNGLFSVPFGVTAISVLNPDVPKMPNDVDMVVPEAGGRVKRLRTDGSVGLLEGNTEIVLSASGGGGGGVGGELSLQDPLTTALPGDKSWRINGNTIKRLRPGTNVTCVDNADALTINANFPSGSTLSPSNTAVSLVVGGMTLKDLRAGTNVSFDVSDTDITINSTASGTGGGGTSPITTTAGAGVSLIKSDHVFKSLRAGTNMQLSATVNEITLNNTYTPTPLTSLGTGTSLVGTNPFTVCSVLAGANIVLSLNNNTLTIASTASGGGGSGSSTVSTGTGVSLLKEDHIFKTLLAGTNITLDNNTDEIVINATVPTLTSAHNASTDYALLTNTPYTLRGITTGNNINRSLLGDSILIGNSWPNPYVTYNPSMIGSCMEGTTIRSATTTTFLSLMSREYINPNSGTGHGWGVLYFPTRASFGMKTSQPHVGYPVVGGNNSLSTFITERLDPWPSTAWMVCTLGMVFKTPTVLFHKGIELDKPRISIGFADSNFRKWRVTVTLTGFDPGMYWEPDIPNAIGGTVDDTFTYACMYTSTNIKLFISGSDLLTSPDFGTTGWVAEPGGTVFTSIPLVSRSTGYTWPVNNTNVPCIAGSSWSLFDHTNSPTFVQQTFNLYSIYFYPTMTDQQALDMYTFHNKFNL